MKKILLISTLAVALVISLNFPALARHFENVELSADCQGYTITGLAVGPWETYDITCTQVDYFLSINGEPAVSGSVEFYPEWPDTPVNMLISGNWDEIPCGNVSIEGTLELYRHCSTGPLDDVETLGPISIYCPCNPGTGTPGYWKNHPEAWPVEEITIGGIPYTKEGAIAYMKMAVKKDKTFTMFPALVSAKLNVLIGNDDSCIADTIAAADEWMATYGPVGSGVRGSSSAWQEGEPLYLSLDDYNNGFLCAPHRD